MPPLTITGNFSGEMSIANAPARKTLSLAAGA
jgi:hypothetical protein